MPSVRARQRRARELATEIRRRRWALIGGAVAGVALFVFVIVLASGGDDSPKQASATTRTTATTRVRRTTTTTTNPDDLSTTTSTDAGGAEVGPGPGSSTESNGGTPPDTGAAPDPTQGGVTVNEAPGACRWNPGTEEMEDAGTLTNPTAEEATIEVQVTWSDASGELDSWSDVVTVPAGGTADWSVSTAWVDAPQGLTCQTALI